MTHLRKMMLEELERRNYAQTTIDCYLRAVAEFSFNFHRPPNQLGPEHIRQYQAHLFGRQKLAPSILSSEEVAQLIDSALTPFHHIVLMTLYATECGARS